MAKPDKTGKDLAQFNIKNAVYALVGDDETIKPMAWMNTFSKDRNITTKAFYGDGELIVAAPSDKKMSGAIGTTARDSDFEKDIGSMYAPDGGGIAEIAMRTIKPIHFGFETDFIGTDGVRKTKKVWVLNMQVQSANESLTQDKEDITESTFDYNYEAYGVNLKDNAGTKDFVDENGQTIRVYTISKKPGEEGYETFLDSVPEPKAPAA